MMRFTDHHAKYFAHELTKRAASDSVEKLAPVLADAQVDLNPHQIDAALFAFRSPFSKGALLADEVGLGKTIEAALLLAQKWAEKKRRLLVIVPANLRKQWSQELLEKFHLPAVILEKRSFKEAIKARNLNPFQQDAVILCSYQFIRTQEPYVAQVPWDLVVIDEAHRLRNVYKASSKIAIAVKQSVSPFPKVLLTATPLQNSLLELYGLVSIIDEFVFGDLSSFRSQYSRLGGDGVLEELKGRIAPLCKRTLRKQVLEYVPYTSRHALVEDFTPSDDEQCLYDWVSEYLQEPKLYALPSGQRQLMTLILRKLLASSTYAISATLEGLVKKLQEAEIASMSVDAPPPDLPDNVEEYSELEDEWDEDDSETVAERPRQRLTAQQLVELRAEMELLRGFHALAVSIAKNSKGERLLTALRRGFEASEKAQKEKGSATFQRKAVVFTESRRTQDYLFDLLQQTEFAGQALVFNGTNNDPASKVIYQKWMDRHKETDHITGSPSADMRAALVEHFRDEAIILIATEAAAEGINLQFCNLVVNYDLPWNPQRIEQRIGRCHRYGQKYDVVVVNFLNRRNAADKRVYELLAEKFQLFNGIFGASDEVLGAVETGISFEKRIADIYQRCRAPEQIKIEFDNLQDELETKIAEGQREAREKLLNNFDQEVVERVRIQSKDFLDRLNQRLWLLTRYILAPHAEFIEDGHRFKLNRNPFPETPIHAGSYRLKHGKDEGDGTNLYRLGHPLAQRVLAQAKQLAIPAGEVVFDYRSGGKNIAALESLIGKSGWLLCVRLTVNDFEVEDHILITGFINDGDVLEEAQARRLFDLPGVFSPMEAIPDPVRISLDEEKIRRRKLLLEMISNRNGHWLDLEMEKFDQWADDRRATLQAELVDADMAIRNKRKDARLAPNLPEKLERQKELQKMESKRNELWRSCDEAIREVDLKKEAKLDEIHQRLDRRVEEETLFTMRWKVQ